MEKTWPTLYKMTNTGKIQEWKIQAYLTNRGTGVYKVTHGQKDGKKQTTQTEIAAGKNIGRANETTIQEQTWLEAEALWTKQMLRKGYKQFIPASKPVLPMLAKNFWEDGNKINYPAMVQPKLDGTRCISSVTNGLRSRTNKEITSVPHILKEILDMNLSYPLDGELYIHNYGFQNLMSAVRKDAPTEESLKIEYWVYDIVAEDLHFEERICFLEKNLKTSQFIKLVPTTDILSKDDIESHLNSYISSGYEGMMIRNKSGKYKINGRSQDLQKVKKFQDQEFDILDVIDGKGKFKGLGIFVLKTDDDATFKATPVGSEDQRREYYVNRKNYIGKRGTVEFFEWTTSEGKRVPRFPIFKAVRNE